jgi:hypothetical protein
MVKVDTAPTGTNVDGRTQEHPEAASIKVDSGHLIASIDSSHIVAIYAPGKWVRGVVSQ